MFSTMKDDLTIYQQVLDVATDYLGPASKRFMDRQIESHLKIEPEKLASKDIPTLTNWTRVALAVLTEDRKLINEFVGRMEHLSSANEVVR